jgi:hypothetical protein
LSQYGYDIKSLSGGYRTYVSSNAFDPKTNK